MSVDDSPRTREHQQDARAWAEFTGGRYTAALRQMRSPLAQGLFGQRTSARQLIRTLQSALIAEGDPYATLGENGFYSAGSWNFNGETDYIELALITDMLRMFTPIPSAETPDVSSYSLKHTAERFLRPHVPYVSNGRLIWAAAALGLPMTSPEPGGPNVLVGVAEREHDYVSRMSGDGGQEPRAHHYRPARYEHLRTALAQLAAGEPITGRWVEPTPRTETTPPFHTWLTAQTGRDDPAGDLAADYTEGVRSSLHRIARTPNDLLTILGELPSSPDAQAAARRAMAEWTTSTRSPQRFRKVQISASVDDHEGWGAGSGTVERHEYACPCGAGKIVEQHDNIPGFREHDVWIDCDECRTQWRFVDGRPARDWQIEPVAPAS